MIVKWIFTAVMLYLDLVHCVAQELEIAKGVIKGQILKSRNGRFYYSYTGIPYAKPPIGELRFKVYNLFVYIILYSYGHRSSERNIFHTIIVTRCIFQFRRQYRRNHGTAYWTLRKNQIYAFNREARTVRKTVCI